MKSNSKFDIFTDPEVLCLLNLLTDNTGCSIILSDRDLNIIYSSDFPDISIIQGEKLSSLFCEKSELNDRKKYSSILETGKPVILNNISIKSKNDNINYYNIKISSLNDYLILHFRKINEIKRFKFENDQLKKQLYHVSSSLHNVKEEERKIIAREIHDELGQSLIGIKVIAQNIFSDDYSESKSSLIDVFNNSVTDIINSLKRITAELLPPWYENETFSKNVIYKINEFMKLSDIEFSCKIEPQNLDIRKNDALDLIRILQEALTNIIKHSHATKADVFIKKYNDRILLSVTDNGIGISDNDTKPSYSFGIRGMYMRCEDRYRELSIKGKPNIGTEVKAVFYFDKY